MFGIEDPWIWSAYLLCILSALLCVVYGLIARFARGPEEAPGPQDKHWAEQEKKVEEEL